MFNTHTHTSPMEGDTTGKQPTHNHGALTPEEERHVDNGDKKCHTDPAKPWEVGLTRLLTKTPTGTCVAKAKKRNLTSMGGKAVTDNA